MNKHFVITALIGTGISSFGLSIKTGSMMRDATETIYGDFMVNVLYLIGSLRNERIPQLANRLREESPHTEVFDDWFGAGPKADDHWKTHQIQKGLSYQEALEGYAARHVFAFDKKHLDRSTHALLVLPAGKSGHMEVMYAAYGAGAKAAILLDNTDIRWDVMYQFIPNILSSDEEVVEWLNT